MASSIVSRVPMVGGIAYRERVSALPASFTATLAVEPDNRYFLHAIAVLVNGDKVGYVAPEVAPGYYDAVQASASQMTCPARRSSRADHETSGVEVLLDFSAVPAAPVQ
jgi:hypothetical protein